MNLQRLLLLHAFITGAASIVLVAVPGFIPGVIDMELTPGQYLLCYFLAAAEGAIAYISFSSRSINDPYSLKIVVHTMILFHALTALLEAYALIQGASIYLAGNVIVRIFVIFLFYYYGIFKRNT